MGELDAAVKALFQADPAALVRLALGRDVTLREVAAEDTELPVSALRADKVLRYTLARETRPRWLHFEVLASPTREAPRRAHEYWTYLHRAFDRLTSVLIVLKRGNRRGAPKDVYLVGDANGREVLRFKFDVVRVWADLHAEDLLAGGLLGLLPLLPFAEGASEDRVHRAMRALDVVPELQRRADLQGVLAVFASDAFPSRRWLDTIPVEILMKTRFFDDLRALAEAHAKADAEAKVKTTALAEGRAELLLMQLHLRLGAEVEAWTSAIKAADAAVVDALARAVAEGLPDEALRARLRELLRRES